MPRASEFIQGITVPLKVLMLVSDNDASSTIQTKSASKEADVTFKQEPRRPGSQSDFKSRSERQKHCFFLTN